MRPIRSFAIPSAMALAIALLASIPAVTHAQHSGGQAPMATVAPKEAAQFDFLVGQWELTVKPKAVGLGQKIHGVPKLRGSWKAWKTMESWGIEDDLRIVDAAGNPVALTHFTRLFDATDREWAVAAADVYRGRFVLSTAKFADGTMTAIVQGTDNEGKPLTTRTRFSQITATSFRFQQDKSTDGGKTWDEATLVIEAKRTAAVAPR
jgi:hypothetical protein